ncbi:beta-lactamase [Sulfobacillus acidophilus DSM 10332]|uniref:Beta-lactamase n=1 Tax=Sulfobacillus acidophilus (strain ATCC 700253 / DSM 10332 / NAL) TaxID=679936 RepID=G8TU74_SULAD|nr:beta-lactamase [Sulfobacillus acidophilus DSM 10332]
MNAMQTLDNELMAVQREFSGRYAVYAEHLGTGETVSFGDVQTAWETASVMKLPILTEALRQCQEGVHALTEPVEYRRDDGVPGSGVLQYLTPGVTLPFKDVLTLMVIVSDNVATNMVLRTIGIEAVNQTCHDMGLMQTRVMRRIDFSSPDPLGLSSPFDLVQLLKSLYFNTVLDSRHAGIAVEILRHQQYQTLLTRYLPYDLLDDNDREIPIVTVASKSGSLTGIRNDAGLVISPWGDYAVAIMSEASKDRRFHVDTEAFQVLPRVSRAIFDYFIPEAEREL